MKNSINCNFKPIQVLLTVLLLVMAGCDNSSTNKEAKKLDSFQKKQKLSHTDYNQLFDNSIVGGVPVQLLEIGDLNVPTGQIVVCDPFVYPDTQPLNETVKPGKYPVKIYIAKTKESGDRYAIAKLEFSSKKADKWVLAVRDGEDISELKEKDAYFGFPVDAGLGGFFDYKSGKEYIKFTGEYIKKHPKGDIYDDLFATEFKKNAANPTDPHDVGDWINYNIPATDLNITMFHSGYGDGTYPAYWGMTKDNEIVSLIIDFFVLSSPEVEK